jgi:hypothetical protein
MTTMNNRRNENEVNAFLKHFACSIFHNGCFELNACRTERGCGFSCYRGQYTVWRIGMRLIPLYKNLCKTIVLEDICSNCGCETIVHITPTSGGYGLLGGALFKFSADEYLVKCRDCYQVSPKTPSRKFG